MSGTTDRLWQILRVVEKEDLYLWSVVSRLFPQAGLIMLPVGSPAFVIASEAKQSRLRAELGASGSRPVAPRHDVVQFFQSGLAVWYQMPLRNLSGI
jgi:hypothetical protein